MYLKLYPLATDDCHHDIQQKAQLHSDKLQCFLSIF